MPGGLPETPVRVDDRSGLLLDAQGRRLEHRYVLADSSVELAGTEMARDARKGIVLLRAAGPLRALTRVTGLYPNDSWSGRRVTYLRRASVPADRPAVVRVPLRPQDGTCTVVFEVDPVTVPEQVTGGANPDARELGLHFDRFDVSGPGVAGGGA